MLAQGDDIVSISGTKRRSYLEENVGASKSIPNPRRSGPQLAHYLTRYRRWNTLCGPAYERLESLNDKRHVRSISSER
jgi:hypothetical protein